MTIEIRYYSTAFVYIEAVTVLWSLKFGITALLSFT